MSPLVGRAAEMQDLERMLARAREGAGSVVLVGGEPGIGKSRLCADLSRLHRQRGGRALLGRAVPEEASLPCAALADALRAARRAEPAVWEAAVARADVLASVVPELASEAGRPERLADRPVLFEALLDTADEAAGETAALWVIDDIHWADDSTWAFLRYAARRIADLSVVLAACYREEEIGPAHPRWPGLIRMRQEPSVMSLPLRRLAQADGERLARGIDPALPEETVVKIVRRAAGTPLLVEELTRFASRPGHLLRVPDIVRAIVQERSKRLTAEAISLLEIAATAGLEIDADLLESVQPGDRIGDLVAAGLIDHVDGGLRFRHPLLQEAVYAELPLGRRRGLHERIAAAMERSGTYSAERIAAHLEQAGHPEGGLLTLEKAAQQASEAGEAGRTATCQLAAVQLVRRHRSLQERRQETERAAINGLFEAGRWSELDPLVRGAWPGRHVLPRAERARLAAVFCAHLFWTGSVVRALRVAKEELAILDESAGLEDAGLLLREAALIAWYNGDGESARNFVDRALEVARKTSDPALELRAGRFEIFIRFGENGDPEAAIADLSANAAVARAHGLAIPERLARRLVVLLAGAARGAGDVAPATAQADSWSWLADMYEASFYLAEGNHQESSAIFGRIRHEYRVGVPTIAAWITAKEAGLHLHRGDLDEAQRLLGGPGAMSEAASCGLIGAEWSTAHGWLAWEQEHFDAAAMHFAAACTSDLMRTYNAICPGPSFLPLHIDALMRLDRPDEATAAVAAVESLKLDHNRFIAAGIAAARFRQEPGRGRAIPAEAMAAAAPWPWLQAQLGCWRGEFLAEPGAVLDARERFEAMGAQRGIQRAEAVMRQLGIKLPRAPRGTSVLSPREVEVAELIAEGLSNPAIARRLHLSRPTVASHVAHILAKLGYASRAQIAAWAAADLRSQGKG